MGKETRVERRQLVKVIFIYLVTFIIIVVS